MPVLRAIAGDNAGEVFVVSSVTLIGRHDSCHVRLTNRAVSRKHALIQEESGKYWIEDLGSRNATRVNDVVIEQRTRIRDGDRISVCNYEFDFDATDDSTKSHQPLVDTTVRPAGIPIQINPRASSDQSSIISRVDMSHGYDARRLATTSKELLASLLEIAQELNQSHNVYEDLSRVLDALMELFPNAQRGAMLRRFEDGEIHAICLRNRKPGATPSVHFSRQVIELVMNTKQAVLLTDVAGDARFNPDHSLAQLQIQSLICAPQIGGDGEVLGAIQLDAADKRAAFTDEDLNVLATIALQVGLALDNLRLRDKSFMSWKWARDLELARRVQVKFLPLYPPKVPPLNFFDFYQPAIAVGGDIYDYVQLPGNKIAIVVADIVGHGVTASLLMAKLSAEIKFSLGLEPTLSAAVARMNRAMCQMAMDKFATMAICLVDADTLELSVVNAGHQPPLLKRPDGTIVELGEDIGGLPLGIIDDENYEVFTMQLAPGDMLVMMTDGVWECCGANEEPYGMERLSKVLAACRGNADHTGELIMAAVKRYIADCLPEDDMCLVCVQCDPDFGR